MNVYTAPWWLPNGLAMTLYMSAVAPKDWQSTLTEPEPNYTEQIYQGIQTNSQDVSIFALRSPIGKKGTVIATYGITGSLEDQFLLRILGRKLVARDYGAILFDWRAHGKTALLSPVLTSDGIYEGDDFVQIALQARNQGYLPPFYFMGYSLGGQLALWGAKVGSESKELGTDFGGCVAVCPNLDANRSMSYLVSSAVGRKIEQAIARNLKKLAIEIAAAHPGFLDPEAVKRANSITTFDRELVIRLLGFATVEDYYNASSPMPFLANLTAPTAIFYAADDPMFDPALIPELQQIAQQNPNLDLILTANGGHVGYISSPACQSQWSDRDPWWMWNRTLEWLEGAKLT
jgi:uncharacterized protein